MQDPCLGKENSGQPKEVAAGSRAGPFSQDHEQQEDPSSSSCQPWASARQQLVLTVDVRNTPPAPLAWAPPVSCPSRLQHTSPARSGSAGSFDPFAASDEPPGCTPLCGTAHPAAPPAVRKVSSGSGDEGSSPAAAPRQAALFADRVQSCPPERMGRRGNRPLVRLRVKRSLNGAVAAAAGPPAVRRSLDALPQQLLAGCSRKRFEEADLVSPPMPRKSSRTLLDEEQAADMLARLQLAGTRLAGQTDGVCGGDGTAGVSMAAQELATGMSWAPTAVLAPAPTALLAALPAGPLHP